jgi:hypothetical protein
MAKWAINIPKNSCRRRTLAGEKLLPDQVGCLAAQDDTAATQVGLQFVQGRLDFPALVIERRQLFGGRCRRIE